MGIFEWGEKRFARGIAKAMLRSYRLYKKDDSSLNELELAKKTLGDRPGEPAKQLLVELEDDDFWKNIAGSSFTEIIYLLVRMEYVEYMNGTMENENAQTNAVFRQVILSEVNPE
ncbi:MAG TPA: hypothetical protein VJI73_00140 [Candidatus Paceibacterota bacterium]